MTPIKNLLDITNQKDAINGSFSNDEILGMFKAVMGINPLDDERINKQPIKTKSLTSRERQIFGLIGNSLSTKAIAKNLGLSDSTVETHRKNIRRKLNLNGKGKLFEIAFLFKLANIEIEK